MPLRRCILLSQIFGHRWGIRPANPRKTKGKVCPYAGISGVLKRHLKPKADNKHKITVFDDLFIKGKPIRSGIGIIKHLTSRIQEYINSTFAKFLNTFLTNDSYGELNNFDESERIEMLRDRGMMVISLMGVKEKDQALDQVLMLSKLTKDGIFSPIEDNKICENIAIIHAGRDNSDIEKEVVIAEVGKPKNVFEGYNGRSTLIAVSGLDYPVSHVSKLGSMAKTAYEERQRNRKHVEKLGSLGFMEDETSKTVIQEKKKPSKWEVLQKKMKK